MKITLSCPSKTFLFGEYAVLEGGVCAVVNTEPRFQLKVNLRGEGRCAGIHPQSPAGLWVRKNVAAFQRYDIDFVDPHSGSGGLGASSAQFLLTYSLLTLLGSQPIDWGRSVVEPEKLWAQYRQIIRSEKGKNPSGADVVAQLSGQITGFSNIPFEVMPLRWPFKNEGDFVIARTGQKLATHKHLNSLTSKNFDVLKSTSQACFNSFKSGRWLDFCSSIEKFGDELGRQDLVLDHTGGILASLKNDQSIRAAKGCGALGADTFVIFVDSENLPSVMQGLDQNNMEVIATSKDMSQGLDMQMSLSGEVTGKVTAEVHA